MRKSSDIYLFDEICEIIQNGEHVVFFGGAGVSTDSGIPDFRGLNGLYTDAEEDGSYLMSIDCLLQEPNKFFDFYRNHIYQPYAEPSDAHLALAELERAGILQAVITQNIDGLHQKARSANVIELHGSGEQFYCVGCGESYKKDVMNNTFDIPHCPKCGGMIRPNITLYGESPESRALAEAEEEISVADVLIVGGTSLSVNPAASLVADFMGEHLIIINDSSTEYDGLAEYVIRASLGDVLTNIVREIQDESFMSD